MKVPPWIEMSRPRAQAGRRLDIFLTHCGLRLLPGALFCWSPSCIFDWRGLFFEGENFLSGSLDSPPGPKSERRASGTQFSSGDSPGSSGPLSMDTANAISSRGHSTTLATGSYGASCFHTLQTDGSHIVRPTAAARYHNSPTSTIAVRRIPDVPPANP